MAVQLRSDTKLTVEQYISQKAWLSATLPSCPVHGRGCQPIGNGYYWRKYPQPLAVARFYCERARTTFSLLPDFLSSRYRGTLAEFEEVCVLAESGDCLTVANTLRSIEVAATISAPSAERWVKRRLVLFEITVLALLGVLAEALEGVRHATELRQRLACPQALVALRALCAQNLAAFPPPLGFGPWPSRQPQKPLGRPHTMGPEPPAPSGYWLPRCAAFSRAQTRRNTP